MNEITAKSAKSYEADLALMCLSHNTAARLADLSRRYADEPTFILDALGVVARSGSLYSLAEATGISRQGLHKAMTGQSNPSFRTVVAVARELGLRLELRPGGAPR